MRFAEATRATPRGVPRASPPPTRGARRLPTLSRCPAGQTSLARVATAITIAVPKAPMQENSTVSITTLIICTLPSYAASSQAIVKPLRDVGRKVAAAILNHGGIRFPLPWPLRNTGGRVGIFIVVASAQIRTQAISAARRRSGRRQVPRQAEADAMDDLQSLDGQACGRGSPHGCEDYHAGGAVAPTLKDRPHFARLTPQKLPSTHFEIS